MGLFGLSAVSWMVGSRGKEEGAELRSGGFTTWWKELLLWPVTTVFPSCFCLMGRGAPKPAPGVFGTPASPLTVTAGQWDVGFESPFSFLLQINELSNVPVPVMLMPDDFKAYSKIKVDNHLFNK